MKSVYTENASTSIAGTRQQREALRRANTVRLANAETLSILGGLKPVRGRLAVAKILRHPKGEEPALRVGTLLGAVRYVGPTAVAKLCAQLGIDEHKRVGANGERRQDTLTERQREALAAAFWDAWR